MKKTVQSPTWEESSSGLSCFLLLFGQKKKEIVFMVQSENVNNILSISE